MAVWSVPLWLTWWDSPRRLFLHPAVPPVHSLPMTHDLCEGNLTPNCQAGSETLCLATCNKIQPIEVH